ncbi:MAG: hypothetical protein J6Q42_03295 [Clostridia bacterium]|nr:hypothetical protein [Clostridia bacterium]
MVLRQLKQLLIDKFGCDGEDVELATALDDLNLHANDREEIAVLLGELYGIELPTETVQSWEYIEDIVASFED